MPVCLLYQFINVLLTPDMKSVHLSLFLLLVASSREFGIQASKQEHKFTNIAVDANKLDRREGVFEGKESSVVQDASDILFREDGDKKEGLRETEDYQFNGRSLDESNYNEGSNSNSEDMFSNSYSSKDKYTMVEKSLEESSQSSVSNGWNLPSIETVQGWASSAYSQLPSRQTVASYVPERVQQYLPSQQTIESYMPPIKSVGTQLHIPLDYFKRKLLGGYKPQKLLTTEERDRLVQALSNKLLNKEGEDNNIKDLMNEVAQNVARRAEDNMTPIVIKLVVHRVVHAMAVSYIGPIGVLLARKQIDSLADAVADYAVAQYVKAGPNRIDLYSYLKQINWKAVYGNIVKIINTYYTSNTPKQ